MAVSSRAFVLSRITGLSPRPLCPPQSSSFHHLVLRPLLPLGGAKKKPVLSGCRVVGCLISGVDGGGVSDDFVSTSKAGFAREFSVVANILKQIKPLDTLVISKGVSDSSKDSMKQTISTMLGLLPSDQFSVSVRASKDPLRRLLLSSMITGYTLWNAEYRISLTRNFDISDVFSNASDSTGEDDVSAAHCGEDEHIPSEGVVYPNVNDLQTLNLGDLPDGVLDYIKHLHSEVQSVKEELSSQKQQNIEVGNSRGSNNILLKFLRSLEPDMLKELSRPSSSEVEDIMRLLVQNIVCKFFKDEEDIEGGDSDMEGAVKREIGNNGNPDTIRTSRDYLAKLLFWCMLLGHHLRGLENRLQLSCCVGFL